MGLNRNSGNWWFHTENGEAVFLVVQPLAIQLINQPQRRDGPATALERQETQATPCHWYHKSADSARIRARRALWMRQQLITALLPTCCAAKTLMRAPELPSTRLAQEWPPPTNNRASNGPISRPTVGQQAEQPPYRFPGGAAHAPMQIKLCPGSGLECVSASAAHIAGHPHAHASCGRPADQRSPPPLR
jgi:hypothetical protein